MGRKKKSEERNSSAGAEAHQQASLCNASSRSPSPVKERSDITGEKGLSESAEKKKKRNWLKRIFSRGTKSKESSVSRSTSAFAALGSPTKSAEDGAFSDDNTDRTSPPILAVSEDSDEEVEGDGHASTSNQNMTRQTSSPAYLGGFRKRPVTVVLGDDVWAQVKAKQDAMFQDNRLLKVDPGISSSATLPRSPTRAERNDEDRLPAKVNTLKPLDVSDDEWVRVRAAQEKMFDSTMDSREDDENTIKNISGALTALYEEAKLNWAALAKKEEQTGVKEEPTKSEASKMGTKETTESDDPIDVDLDAHEFFADIENHEFFADLGDKREGTTSPTTDTSEREISTPDIVVSADIDDKKQSSPVKINMVKTDTGPSQASLKDLVRQRSLKLRSDREHKRHTIASPLFLEGEQELWESVQSQHHALIGDLGTKPIPDRLDGLKADVQDSSPEEIRPESKELNRSGLLVAEKLIEEQKSSTVPGRLEQKSEEQKSEDGEVMETDSRYLSADLSVVPVIQPSLGLSAGRTRRNLSRKNKRRPPSVKVPTAENQVLFQTPEPRARSNSTGGADEETKAQAAEAVEMNTKSLQRARTVAGCGKKLGKGALTITIPEQKSPESKDKQPAWLEELEKKRRNKQETSDKTNPLYKTKKELVSPTKELSTASLVAEAAKRKTAQENMISFKQPKSATNGRPRSMFVSPSGGSNEPPWVVLAQKKSGGTVSPLTRSPGSVNNSKSDWVVKAQKMQSQEREQDKASTSPVSETSKLQAKPVKQSSIEDRIKSLRKSSNAAAT